MARRHWIVLPDPRTVQSIGSGGPIDRDCLESNSDEYDGWMPECRQLEDQLGAVHTKGQDWNSHVAPGDAEICNTHEVIRYLSAQIHDLRAKLNDSPLFKEHRFVTLERDDLREELAVREEQLERLRSECRDLKHQLAAGRAASPMNACSLRSHEVNAEYESMDRRKAVVQPGTRPQVRFHTLMQDHGPIPMECCDKLCGAMHSEIESPKDSVAAESCSPRLVAQPSSNEHAKLIQEDATSMARTQKLETEINSLRVELESTRGERAKLASDLATSRALLAEESAKWVQALATAHRTKLCLNESLSLVSKELHSHGHRSPDAASPRCRSPIGPRLEASEQSPRAAAAPAAANSTPTAQGMNRGTHIPSRATSGPVYVGFAHPQSSENRRNSSPPAEGRPVMPAPNSVSGSPPRPLQPLSAVSAHVPSGSGISSPPVASTPTTARPLSASVNGSSPRPLRPPLAVSAHVSSSSGSSSPSAASSPARPPPASLNGSPRRSLQPLPVGPGAAQVVQPQPSLYHPSPYLQALPSMTCTPAEWQAGSPSAANNGACPSVSLSPRSWPASPSSASAHFGVNAHTNRRHTIIGSRRVYPL
mmetsp:Transcript_20237/g.50571  ORF Transcript_20237/g.50571 Transcript_20237/m.50571 type:complete len:593 (-) Transcript_20237:51-1829(-)